VNFAPKNFAKKIISDRIPGPLREIDQSGSGHKPEYRRFAA
jgi:hypothetical protein